MSESTTKIMNKRREYVNERISELTKGKNLSRTKQRMIFRKVWREAKQKYK